VFFFRYSTIPPIIKRPIPHQRELPGITFKKSVVNPELISDHPIVV
jgi:hypothetical protein